MILYSSLIGLPILCSNKKIGVVKDILYSSKFQNILGLVVEEKNIIKPYKYISIDDIEELNKTSIKINNNSCIKLINKNDSIYDIVDNPYKCSINSNVYINKDRKIGKVKDIIFNFEQGLIEGYIITDGLIEDLISGRKIINNKNVCSKRDKLIIKNKRSE